MSQPQAQALGHPERNTNGSRGGIRAGVASGPSIILPPGHLTVSRALDEASAAGSHSRTVITAGMGFFTDAYDLFIIGIAVVLLTPLWHLSTEEVSLLTSTSLGAAFLGALVGGRMADVVGRKRMYTALAITMILAAVASASELRLAGGRPFRPRPDHRRELSLSATLASEFSSRAQRGRLVGLAFSIQALGLVVGPLVGIALLGGGLPHDVAWRVMLGLGALPGPQRAPAEPAHARVAPLRGQSPRPGG